MMQERRSQKTKKQNSPTPGTSAAPNLPFATPDLTADKYARERYSDAKLDEALLASNLDAKTVAGMPTKVKVDRYNSRHDFPPGLYWKGSVNSPTLSHAAQLLEEKPWS